MITTRLTSLAPALLLTPSLFGAPELIGTGDFGASTAQSLPDGTDDLVWLDRTTGAVWVQFMHASGESLLRAADLNGLTSTPVMGEGSVMHIDVLDGGSGYRTEGGTGDLIVDDTAVPGTGLAGTFNVTGSIAEVKILDGGSGYHDSGLGTFIVDEAGTGGSGMDFIYLTQPGDPDAVRSVQLVDEGEGYEPGAELAVINANFLNDDEFTSPFAGIAYVDTDGTIRQVDIAEAGEGFMETPELIILGAAQGGGAKIQAFMGGSIYSIIPHPQSVDPGGSGYFADPVLMPEVLGTGFEYEIVREGEITEATVVTGGADYVEAPLIEAADGTGAAFSINLFTEQETWPAGEVPARTFMAGMFQPDGTKAQLHNSTAVDMTSHVTDVDGDGDSDIVWWSPSNFQCILWIMGEGTVQLQVPLPIGDPAWRLVCVRDLDGNPGAELIWHDRETADVQMWSIDPLSPTFLSETSGPIINAGPGVGWRLVGVLDGDTGGPRLVWNDIKRHLWSMVELDSDQLNVGLEATAMASADGEAWTPNPGEYLQGVGDFDGDGVKDDFIVRRNSGKQQGMMEVWRTQEGIIQGDDILAWGNHTIVAPRVPIAVNDNNETQDTSIVFSNRGEAVVLTMPARATVLDMPEEALALLVQPVAALGELDPLDWADGVADFINDADDVSGASIYLRYQHVQSALFAGLDLGLQVTLIDAIAEEYGTKGSAGSNSGTVVSTSQRIDNQGNVVVTGPRVMNRHYDYLYPGNEYRYGGPDNASGSASGAESGSNSGSSGSGSSGSGGSGDTGSGGGGGSGAGGWEDGQIPDDFDPNDESTWPPGVDTFEELMAYLQNLAQGG